MDGADVLDLPGRVGLARMMLASGIPSAVAMTQSRAAIDKMGGKRYWLEGGTAHEL